MRGGRSSIRGTDHIWKILNSIIMSETKNHHYVPKVYLREFGIGSGKELFVWIQEIDGLKSNPRKEYIGKSLCASDYFYKINSEKSFLASQFGNNQNIIEDKGFPYENSLRTLFDKLKKKNIKDNYKILVWEDADLLVYSLISMKFRNPFVREAYAKGKSIMDEATPVLRNDISKILRGSEHNPQLKKLGEELRLKIEYDWENPDESINTIHSTAMYYEDSIIQEKINKLGERIMHSRWSIIQTNVNEQFITSDNPGIFLNQKEVYSLLFDDFEEKEIDRFFFPLSGLHGLLIHLFEPDRISNEGKTIPFIYSPKSVMEYNICHCNHVNKILIASSKIALNKAFEQGKDSWIDVKKR